ncbi:Leucine-rich repeat-containing protein 27 [Harpegnathos saltator]|uniref:Leucine-rich repeat-containing protein 27 n=1 Tax=Harpegnathos saltator TaxID=610380 RepID=E2C2W8_HARSA|nr:Leucine-rich repeat-containing protein 27 [Harpegnathos saltator]
MENNVDALIGHQSTIDSNDDDTTKETEEDVLEGEKKNSRDDIPVPARSSRSLEWEALENVNETSSGFDIILEANTAGNFYEDTAVFCGEETHDVTATSGKIISTTLDPEDIEGNDSYLSLSEDVSDVSSIAGRKKPNESSNAVSSLLTPLPKKTPTYNDTFIDLTNTGLTSLSVETIEKYPTIKMLYLENNDLFELPKELFFLLPRLQWLDVRNNRLKSLPTTIKSHPSLETILLQGNKIETLPLELCWIPRLKTLNAAHNPIATPPKNIIALGCSSILSYLRTEWNKLHPDELVTFVEREIEPNPSTILCYQSPREKLRRLSKIQRRESKGTSDIGDSCKGVSVSKRARAYRASNRCSGKGTNAMMEQRLYWISKARDLLNAQSATIQRVKDADTIKEWRRNKRSFSKSMEKVSRRNEDDIPFAIDIEDYPEIKKRPEKTV